MKWFTDVSTIEELRKKYRELLKLYHPDNGGNVSDMQSINTEYDISFDVLSKKEQTDRQSYTQEENEQFKAILSEIIGYNMTIEIIGSWVWCFDCFVYKERLKELGFHYAPKKKAWTWHFGDYKCYHTTEISIEDIRQKYGSHKVTNYEKQYAIN